MYGFTSTWKGVLQLGGCDTALNQCLSYDYDEFNRLTSRNVNTGAQTQGQYYWGGKRVGFYSGGSLYFQHQDWMGTERARTTYNGGVEGKFASLPFGDGLTTVSGTDLDAYHFATVDHDYEDETDHAQFRQYSEAQGHWLAPDPYGGSHDFSNPQSFNRYAYVLNNPLSNVDPDGRECVWGDGSYDASDDPDTGSPEGCAAAGGNYVPPAIFEGVEGTNPGDWSPNASSTIAADWTTPSITVSAGLCPGPIASTLTGAAVMGMVGGPAAGAQALAIMTGHVITLGLDASTGLKLGTFGFSAHAGESLAFDPQGNIAEISTSGGGGGGFAGDNAVTAQVGFLQATSVLSLTNDSSVPNFSIAAGEGVQGGISADLGGNVNVNVGAGEGVQTGFTLDSTQVHILSCSPG